MKTTGRYVFDSGAIEEKCFDLLCIFYSNKEISRRIDPIEDNGALAQLHKRFFESKMSRLLIEIAVSLRVMDDQMKNLPKTDGGRKQYLQRLKRVDKLPFGLFDDLNLNMRQVCNKIIHSEVFEFYLRDGDEAHETDVAFRAGMQERSVRWQYASEHVRLSGILSGVEWYVLLSIEEFVSGVYELFRHE